MNPPSVARRRVWLTTLVVICIGAGTAAWLLAPYVAARYTLATTHSGSDATFRGTVIGPGSQCVDGTSCNFYLVDVAPGIKLTLFLPTVDPSLGASDPGNQNTAAFLQTALSNPKNKPLVGSRIEMRGLLLKDLNAVFVEEPGEYVHVL